MADAGMTRPGAKPPGMDPGLTWQPSGMEHREFRNGGWFDKAPTAPDPGAGAGMAGGGMAGGGIGIGGGADSGAAVQGLQTAMQMGSPLPAGQSGNGWEQLQGPGQLNPLLGKRMLPEAVQGLQAGMKAY